MYTYIKNNIHGTFFTSDVLLDTIDGYQDAVGQSWVDYENGKFLLLSQEQLDFYVANPSASIKNVWDMETPSIEEEDEMPHERTLEDAKDVKANAIRVYDMSDAVNGFYVGDDFLWLDKDTRAGLKLRFEAEKALGADTTTLWYGTKQYALPIDTAIMMLLMIEFYASKCYDNTQQHLANVDALQSISEVDSYEFHSGYPDMLHF